MQETRDNEEANRAEESRKRHNEKIKNSRSRSVAGRGVRSAGAFTKPPFTSNCRTCGPGGLQGLTGPRLFQRGALGAQDREAVLVGDGTVLGRRAATGWVGASCHAAAPGIW